MKKITLFSVLVLIEMNIYSQSKWVIYLGEEMNALYSKSNGPMVYKDGYYFRTSFGSDSVLSIRLIDAGIKNDTARDGVILTAKSSEQYTEKGKIIFGNNKDSALITYFYAIEKVTRGRSALLSILNLFSKKENRIEQDKPTTETIKVKTEGVISYQNDSCYFKHIVGPKDNPWLQLGNDTLKLVQAGQFRKTKTDEIKTRKNSYEGVQLMKDKTCVAALDFNEAPMAFYLLNTLSEKEKLIITSFFLLRDFSKEN
jgi:hypothetical protein